MANNQVYVMPMEASWGSFPFLWKISIINVVRIPKIAAPMSIGMVFLESNMRKLITSPGNTAWEMASPIIEDFLSTKKVPISPVEAATSIPVNMIQNALTVVGLCKGLTDCVGPAAGSSSSPRVFALVRG